MTSFILLIAVLLLLVIPFEIWTFLENEERYKLLRRLYIFLPSKLSKYILPIYWRYAYEESQVMFWGRCFPNSRHNWVDTGKGLHCRDCHSHIPSWNLTGSKSFPSARDYIEILL